MRLIRSSTSDSEDNFLERVPVVAPSAGKFAAGNSSACLMPGRSFIAREALGPCSIHLQAETGKRIGPSGRPETQDERYAEKVAAARLDQSTFLARIPVSAISTGRKRYLPETISVALCLANSHRGGAAIESQKSLGIPVRGVPEEIRDALTRVIFSPHCSVVPRETADRPREKAPTSARSYAPPGLQDSSNEGDLRLLPAVSPDGGLFKRLPAGLSAISGAEQPAGLGLDVNVAVEEMWAVAGLVQTRNAHAGADPESRS